MKIDENLAQQLIQKQFPEWKDLIIRAVEKSGWDNRTFHLGDEMTIRIPSKEEYAPQILKESKWLPILGKELSCKITDPLGLGKPSENYPWHWSINKWIEGDTASLSNIIDLNQFAKQLGIFVKELHGIDASNGPVAGSHNFHRGGDLSVYSSELQEALSKVKDFDEKKIASSIWEEAVSTKWDNTPVWVHGDFAVGNILIKDGELNAVIDFGCLAVGDPACDLAIAWNLFDSPSRHIFREILALDQNTWIRGMAWTLWKTLCCPIEGTPVNKILSDIYYDYKVL